MKRFTGLSFSWIVRLAVLVLILALPLVVFADNTVPDGDGVEPVGPNALNFGTVCAGSSTTKTALVVITRQGSSSTNVFKNSSTVTVSVHSTAGTGLNAVMSGGNTITLPPNWDSLSNGTDSTSVASDVTFVAGAAGTFSGSVVYRGSGVNSSNNPINRDGTLSVNATVVNCDSTPPVITPNVSGTLGNNGWYVSDVTVSWSVVDPESTISSSSGCGSTTISADTAGTTLTCSATSAGGTSSQSVTIKRDATAPTISGSSAPAPNGNGWNNSDVTVSFTCNDNLSGVASCGPNQTLSGDGAGQSASGTAADNAGNSASTTVSNISIDKTAPAVSVTGVSNDAIYTLGSVPAAGCSTTDALSGVATEATLSSSGGPVGSVTATCSGAADNAGNTGSASVTYSVIYNWSGFFSPVDNGGTFNQVKAGSAIPVKFSLAGNQGLSIFMAGYPTSVKINCSTTAPIDTIEETVTAGSSSLSYDATTDRYNYVWKTDKAWGGTCRQLTVKLIDGTTHTANFNFTK